MATCRVVVVNFNSAHYLSCCLESIRKYDPQLPIVVVDNGSSDGSDEAALLRDPTVVLRRNSSNIGFARAMNQALSQISDEFVLLLNPDCELQPGSIDVLLDAMTTNPACAIAAPQIVDKNGSVQGNARGDPTALTGLFGRSTLMTRLLPNSSPARRNIRFDLIHAERGVIAPVDWVAGTCLMVRRSSFEHVNGFDERYFLYWEDADLCRRLRNRGYTILYVPASRVVHHSADSRRFVFELATRAFHESALTYYSTHVARAWPTLFVARLALRARCRLALTVAFLGDRYRKYRRG